MDTKDIPLEQPLQDWQPITDKYLIAVLGKLGEESSELSTAIFRCLIQGIDEREPVTLKRNRDWLAEEIADVKALIATAEARLELDSAAIEERRVRKLIWKAPWFEGLLQQASQLAMRGGRRTRR